MIIAWPAAADDSVAGRLLSDVAGRAHYIVDASSGWLFAAAFLLLLVC